jgi:glycosyltransferase involved in cell wall biosynthesis
MDKVGVLAADLTTQHGWAQYSRSMIAALARASVPLTVLTPRDTPRAACDEIAAVGRVSVYPILPPINPAPRALPLHLLRALPTARHVLRECHAIHALIEPFAPLGAWIAGARPFYITAHGSYIRADRAYPRWAVTLYRAAFERAAILAVSRYTADVARAQFPDTRIEVVPNGVDAARFASIIRDHAPRPPMILSVGAVKRRKGTLELIHAFARVRESFPSARLQIVGSLTLEPGYVESVRAAIQQGDLGAAVTLAGRVSDAELMRAYADADIFALPSLNDGWKFEGFGLSLLEAAAACLPTVGTRDCGTADAVADGVTGYLVAQDRLVDGLTDALTRLLSDPALARRMGAAGRARAASQTWDAAAAALAAIYAGEKTHEGHEGTKDAKAKADVQDREGAP